MTPESPNGSPQGFLYARTEILSFSECDGFVLMLNGFRASDGGKWVAEACVAVPFHSESECDLTEHSSAGENASRAPDVIDGSSRAADPILHRPTVGKAPRLGTASGSDNSGNEEGVWRAARADDEPAGQTAATLVTALRTPP